MIDTNIASYFLRRSFPVLDGRMKTAMQAGEVAISVITRAELRYGQSLAPADNRLARLVNGFLEEMPVFDWTASAADVYGRIAAQLKLAGMPIGVPDTQIAAHALAENLVLVTHNTRHFERVPGLLIENWTN
ncbi:MAG: type II toxin-antitoxin system VapC family toxin [Sulfuricellaceae bacterium]|nr:type II toxin-antitoxin system VapC family toxin [Sulfuricellaceae bacterium]